MKLDPSNYPNLPKWPSAYVTGTSVTRAQAKEIIFRTDTAVSTPSEWGISGNDRNFRARLMREFGWNRFQTLHDAENERYKVRKTQVQLELELKTYPNVWDLQNQWSEKMQMVSTEYVYNSFLSTSYIGGPAGWCDPTGRIHFENHNYGKWPSVETILADWTALAAAFPFLELVNTLFSGESSDEVTPSPVCSIIVKDGLAEAHEPQLELHGHPPRLEFDMHMGNLLGIMSGNYASERAWPEDWISEFAQRSKLVVEQVLGAPD